MLAPPALPGVRLRKDGAAELPDVPAPSAGPPPKVLL
jgi:hypothetical protein